MARSREDTSVTRRQTGMSLQGQAGVRAAATEQSSSLLPQALSQEPVGEEGRAVVHFTGLGASAVALSPRRWARGHTRRDCGRLRHLVPEDGGFYSPDSFCSLWAQREVRKVFVLLLNWKGTLFIFLFCSQELQKESYILSKRKQTQGT